MTTNGYHEPVAELSALTRSLHQALATVIEELEAVDWYQQRADVATDEELRAIMVHNRDEELEHAAMGLEWLRRRVPKMDEMLRTYLFTGQPIVAIEEGSRGDDKPTSGDLPEDDLGIGALDTGE